MEKVQNFIDNFYLGSYWIPLCIAAVCFGILSFVLCFFRKPKPLALTAWLSLSCAVLAGLAYIEHFKDTLLDMDSASAQAALDSMYRWFLIGGVTVIALNALALLIGFVRRQHNSRHH